MKKLNLILALALIVVACKKEEEPVAPAPDPIGEYGPGVYDYDSNFYKTTYIVNSGEWMAENLRTSHYNNGDSIPSGINQNDISGLGAPKFFFYPAGDSVNNLKKYGRLYTYYVIEDPRNVCPVGWHVPTKNDFDTLIKYAGAEDISGGKLKSTSLWASPNTGADNESLFTGLPAGYRTPDELYPDVSKTGIWWTNSNDTANRVWTYYLRYNYSNTFHTPSDKNKAYSIRCKRD